MDSSFFSTLVPVLHVGALLALLIAILFVLIRGFVRIKKQKQSVAMPYFFAILPCLLVGLASWLLNMGWLRTALTWIPLPFAYALFFVIVGEKAVEVITLSLKVKELLPAFYATYVGMGVLFPDFGYYGPMHVFFGLIGNDTVATIAGIFSVACLLVNVVFMFAILAEIKQVKYPSKNLLTAELYANDSETPKSFEWTEPFKKLDLQGGELILIGDDIEDIVDITWPDGMMISVGYEENQKIYTIITVANDTKEAWDAPLSELIIKDRNELLPALQQEILRARS